MGSKARVGLVNQPETWYSFDVQLVVTFIVVVVVLFVSAENSFWVETSWSRQWDIFGICGVVDEK